MVGSMDGLYVVGSVVGTGHVCLLDEVCLALSIV